MQNRCLVTNYRDVLLERLDGYLVPSHQDVGLDVYLLGESDGIAFRYGVIEAVYDNGYRQNRSLL